MTEFGDQVRRERAERKAAHEAKPKPDRKKLAKLLAEGGEYQKSMLAAGYSPKTACHGRAGVPDSVWRMVPQKAKKLLEMGKLDIETYKHLVLGRLADNTVQGKDSGVMSAKALGSIRELNLFEPEHKTGIIVVNAPTDANTQRLLESLDEDEITNPLNPFEGK